ncbi:MAG: hypothetical protein HOB32_09230 [Nitrospina sp.]|nr:hypothetical protein [Nitrospina sp.]
MKKVKLIITVAAMLGLVSSSTVYADGFAPGEGLYIGAFVGHSAGHVNAKVVAPGGHTGSVGGITSDDGDITAEITSGGIGLEGIEGGVYLGYGYKMGKMYIGFEMDMAGGGAEFEIKSDRDVRFTVSSSDTVDTTYDKIDVETKWTAGGGARIGYYVSESTLVSVKGGIAASKFDASVGSSDSESFYGGGARVGAAIESALVDIDPNLSVRLAWDYTDYMSAPVNGIGTISEGRGKVNSEVSGGMYNAHLGFQYSFVDVNSLF